MKKLLFLSVISFMLAGCYHPKNKDPLYGQSNLRVPEKKVVVEQPAALPAASSIPQSITQPAPVAAAPVQSAPQQQQPLVQTIVIPQYAPTYGGAMPLPNISGLPNYLTPQAAPQTMPQVASQPMQQMTPPQPVPQQFTQAAPQLPVAPVQTGAAKESVYPAWAASDYTPPANYNLSDEKVFLKNPNYNETVQCASVDTLCISSYQQQGYQPVSDNNGFARKEDAGYPRTTSRETKNNNIPRW